MNLTRSSKNRFLSCNTTPYLSCFQGEELQIYPTLHHQYPTLAQRSYIRCRRYLPVDLIRFRTTFGCESVYPDAVCQNLDLALSKVCFWQVRFARSRQH